MIDFVRPQAFSEPETSAGDADGLIVSTLADDGLRRFLEGYVAELPERVAELESCLAACDLNQLSLKAHNLKGTGGLYGLMPITDASGKVERVIHDRAPIDAVIVEVKALIAIIRRVEGFKPGNDVRPKPASQ